MWDLVASFALLGHSGVGIAELQLPPCCVIAPEEDAHADLERAKVSAKVEPDRSSLAEAAAEATPEVEVVPHALAIGIEDDRESEIASYLVARPVFLTSDDEAGPPMPAPIAGGRRSVVAPTGQDANARRTFVAETPHPAPVTFVSATPTAPDLSDTDAGPRPVEKAMARNYAWIGFGTAAFGIALMLVGLLRTRKRKDVLADPVENPTSPIPAWHLWLADLRCDESQAPTREFEPA